MNIAFLAHPATIHNCKWINHLAKTYKVVVITSPYKSSRSWLDENIDCLQVLPASFSALNPVKTYLVVKKLRHILASREIDVIHSMYAVPNAIWGYLSGFPTHVITTRGSDVLVEYKQNFAHPPNLRYKLAYKRMTTLIEKSFRSASIITSTSQKQQDVIKTFETDTSKMHLIRTGVDLNFLNEELQKLISQGSSDKNNFIIFSPRSMKPIYNIDVIVEAFSHLKKNKLTKNYTLKIIDDTPNSNYGNKVRSLVKSLELESSVQILPRLSQNQMVQNYYEANLVISIPSSDGTPISAIETMLMKRPLLMGNIGYDSDLFNEDTVWMTENLSPEHVAKKLFEIISLDPSNKKNKLQEAYDTAIEKGGLQNSIKEIVKIYNHLNGNARV